LLDRLVAVTAHCRGGRVLARCAAGGEALAACPGSGDDLPVTGTRDAYARINPDSPWRWVPLIAMPFAFVAIEFLWRSTLHDDRPTLGWGVLIALGLLTTFSLRQFSGAGYDAAVQRERETGGRRVVTRPGLALGMFALGMLLLAAWVLAICVRSIVMDTPLAWVPTSIAVPSVGLYLVIFGMQRPWDLEVVERDASAEAT
jgi:hypothetical protein